VTFNNKYLSHDATKRALIIARLEYYAIDCRFLKFRAGEGLSVEIRSFNIAITKKNAGSPELFKWDSHIRKFSVEIVKAASGMNIMVGFRCFEGIYGSYLLLQNGTLLTQDGDTKEEYCSGCKVGDTITCIYNDSASEISFLLNGVCLGVAFTNVNRDIAPAVELFGKTNDCVQLSIVN
jgi:SPRY domain